MEPQSAYPAVCWHQVIDSTNNYAKTNIRGLDNMSVVAAVHQTAGRGQGSHHWVSRPGENLTFSLVLKFGKGGVSELKASEAVRITHFFTVALCRFLAEEEVEARIKWPNDIWVGDRKICGILVENTIESGLVSSSIIGIGLNLNQKEFDPSLPNPVSLGQLTGKKYDPAGTLDRLYGLFLSHASLLDTEKGREELESEFSRRMFVLEKPLQDELQDSIERYEATR